MAKADDKLLGVPVAPYDSSHCVPFRKDNCGSKHEVCKDNDTEWRNCKRKYRRGAQKRASRTDSYAGIADEATLVVHCTLDQWKPKPNRRRFSIHR